MLAAGHTYSQLLTLRSFRSRNLAEGAKAGMVWRYHRTRIILDYAQRTPLPPPFFALGYIYLIFKSMGKKKVCSLSAVLQNLDYFVVTILFAALTITIELGRPRARTMQSFAAYDRDSMNKLLCYTQLIWVFLHWTRKRLWTAPLETSRTPIW